MWLNNKQGTRRAPIGVIKKELAVANQAKQQTKRPAKKKPRQANNHQDPKTTDKAKQKTTRPNNRNAGQQKRKNTYYVTA